MKYSDEDNSGLKLSKNIPGISEIILLILSIFLINSCKKATTETENESASVTDKYIIEMNQNFRISKVIHLIGNNDSDYVRVYSYSEKNVKIYTDGVLIQTYFLNNAGLADSSIEGAYMNQYHYDDSNYLTSMESNDLHIIYNYSNGNRTSGVGIHYSAQYQYNTIINKIDIDEFQGDFLGKLNYNLVQFKSFMFTMASDGYQVDYQYKLNADGLVVKRTGITTYNRPNSSPDNTITYFEYIIKN
jgi:hypothetical protein